MLTTAVTLTNGNDPFSATIFKEVQFHPIVLHSYAKPVKGNFHALHVLVVQIFFSLLFLNTFMSLLCVSTFSFN